MWLMAVITGGGGNQIFCLLLSKVNIDATTGVLSVFVVGSCRHARTPASTKMLAGSHPLCLGAQRDVEDVVYCAGEGMSSHIFLHVVYVATTVFLFCDIHSVGTDTRCI